MAARIVHSGHFRAVWVPASRRWLVYGPASILLGSLLGSREEVLAELRTVNGFPSGCRRPQRPLFPPRRRSTQEG